MNDDILILDPVYEDYEDLKQDHEIKEEVENIIEESKKNETKSDNKSEFPVYNNNALNNLRSNQIVDLGNYKFTEEKVWVNESPNSTFNQGTYIISKDLSDYRYFKIIYKYSTQSNDNNYIIVDKTLNGDLVNGSLFGGLGTRGSAAYYNRSVTIYNNSLIASNCYTSAGSYNNNIVIPIEVYALKLEEITNNETPTPSPNPTVSGNIINNYYNNYFGVSDNSISWNIINKPFNEYTVTESYFAISTLLFLSIGIYLIIRRSIFKWR